MCIAVLQVTIWGIINRIVLQTSHCMLSSLVWSYTEHLKWETVFITSFFGFGFLYFINVEMLTLTAGVLLNHIGNVAYEENLHQKIYWELTCTVV